VSILLVLDTKQLAVDYPAFHS